MRKARILVHSVDAGVLEVSNEGTYRLIYHEDYQGAPISLTMPIINQVYEFNEFPPFFEGLLPEGMMLEALLRKYKIDRNDYFSQLLKVGQDVVGAITIVELT